MGTEQCRSRFNLCLCRALRRCSCTENISAAEIGEDFGAGALPFFAAQKTLSELRHVWQQAEGTNGFMLQRAVTQNFQKDTFHIAMELQPTNEEQPRLKTGGALSLQIYHGISTCDKETFHFILRKREKCPTMVNNMLVKF